MPCCYSHLIHDSTRSANTVTEKALQTTLSRADPWTKYLKFRTRRKRLCARVASV